MAVKGALGMLRSPWHVLLCGSFPACLLLGIGLLAVATCTHPCLSLNISTSCILGAIPLQLLGLTRLSAVAWRCLCCPRCPAPVPHRPRPARSVLQRCDVASAAMAPQPLAALQTPAALLPPHQWLQRWSRHLTPLQTSASQRRRCGS